jgi:hypothetical protein
VASADSRASKTAADVVKNLAAQGFEQYVVLLGPNAEPSEVGPSAVNHYKADDRTPPSSRQ